MLRRVWLTQPSHWLNSLSISLSWSKSVPNRTRKSRLLVRGRNTLRVTHALPSTGTRMMLPLRQCLLRSQRNCSRSPAKTLSMTHSTNWRHRGKRWPTREENWLVRSRMSLRILLRTRKLADQQFHNTLGRWRISSTLRVSFGNKSKGSWRRKIN